MFRGGKIIDGADSKSRSREEIQLRVAEVGHEKIEAD
jgi:hypothetical protein